MAKVSQRNIAKRAAHLAAVSLFDSMLVVAERLELRSRDGRDLAGFGFVQARERIELGVMQALREASKKTKKKGRKAGGNDG